MSGEAVDYLQDFSGGLNTLLAPNRIQPNESPTLDNVWFETGALKKRRGATSQLITTTEAGTQGAISISPTAMHVYIAPGGFSNTRERCLATGISTTSPFTSGNYVIDIDTNTSSVFKFIVHSTGLATTTAGSPTVTGTGTSWTTNVAAGDRFKRNGDGTWVEISTVDSATQLTLVSNYPTGASGAYSITKNWSLSAANMVFEDMNGSVWMSDGTRTPSRYTPTISGATFSPNVTNISAFPTAAFVKQYKNYMFALNYGATPSRAAWSALRDPTSWPASNFVDVNPDDGYPICGSFNDGQSLVILKRASAWKLTGDTFDPVNPTYTLTQIHTPVDFFPETSKAVAIFNGVFHIKGELGLYTYNGGTTIEKHPLSDKIRSRWTSFVRVSLANLPIAGSEPVMTVSDNRLWIVYGDSNSNVKSRIIVLESNGTFWEWNLSSVLVRISDTAWWERGLRSVSGSQNRLYTLDTGFLEGGLTGTAINGTWTSRVYEFINLQIFMRCYVHYRSQTAGNLTFEFSIDEGAFVSNTIDMTTGVGTRRKSSIILVGRIGKSIQFRLSNNVADQDFEVYAIELHRRELRQ